MATTGYAVRCASCHKKTPWDPKKPYPTECSVCGFDFGPDRDDDDVVMPFIRSNGAAKAHDQVYRQMEAASQQRVYEASEASGIPTAELSDLKITDLKTDPRPGAVAAPSLPAHLQNMGGFQSQGNEWAGAVRSGPHPNAGARAIRSLQRATGRG